MSPIGDRSKKHHFRSVLHLRHFTDVEGLLWVHDRTGTVAPFRQIPKNVGYEVDLYTPEGGGDPNAFEEWLSVYIDGPAAEPLAKVAEGGGLNRRERSAIAAFIAMQDLRTPRMRDLMLDFYRVNLGEEWSRWEADPSGLAEAIERDSGRRYEPEEVSELLAERTMRVTRDAWLGTIQDLVNRVGEQLYAKTWSYGRVPDGEEFVTTDTGLVKCVGSAMRPVDWGPGFVGGRSIWVFPITPSAALILENGGEAQAGMLSPAWARAINDRLIQDAARFVYSRSRLAGFDATIHPDLARRRSTGL